MQYKYQYITEEEKQNILDANLDKFLVEVQDITEGKFLIFSDTLGLDAQVAQLKEDNLILMDVLATMYEDMLMKGTV